MKTWIVRPCTLRELAELYNVSYAVFKKHLKPIASEIGPRIGHYYMLKQVIIIIDFYGLPSDVELIFPPKAA